MSIKGVFNKGLIIAAAAFMAIGMSGCGSSNADDATSSPAASTSSTATSALDKDTLIVGIDDTFAPMGFKNENGEIVGFDIDLAKTIIKKMGKQVKFQTIDWDMKETELAAGNIDFIWNGYSITDERKEKVAFSTPYLKNKQVIVTLAGSDIKTKADLSGKVVGAQTGSSAVDAIEADPQVEATFKDGKPVTYESNNDVLMDLDAGRIDAAVADEVVVKYYIGQKGESNYRILSDDFGEEEYAVGMRKSDTELLDAVNKAYQELRGEGKLAEISIKWFGDNITE